MNSRRTWKKRGLKCSSRTSSSEAATSEGPSSWKSRASGAHSLVRIAHRRRRRRRWMRRR
ncbi:hypothetical protein E2C01_092019 [Portunus trituberculatus]|uniref:Uncharacterized protein n=1 Tax=Portunus trituberculatus TaxID=210409 RepID=A0A5B7JQM3_PORTR|nr:hypothetical protein [Portunus trituberculatus]